MKLPLSISTLAFAVFCASPAFALDEIYSPNAEPGELSIGYNGSRTFDNDSAKNNDAGHALSVEYGLNRLMLEASVGFEKSPGEHIKAEEMEIEGRYQFFEQGQYWMDSGLLLAYGHALHHDDANVLEAKLLLQKDTGSFTHMANIGFEQEVGPHRSHEGPDYSVLLNSRYRVNEYFQPGLELQSDLGQHSTVRHFDQQEHYVGPAVYGHLFGHFKYQAAYLFGISDASSDGAARALLEYELHF